MATQIADEIAIPVAMAPLDRMSAPQAAAVDEPLERAGLGEALEVGAGLAQALTETLDVADENRRPTRLLRSTPRVTMLRRASA